jgi:hypothetical protein
LESFLESLAPIFNHNKTFNTDEGGRSGSFFFFTHDRRYIVKTMSSSELKLFVDKFLPQFSNHVNQKKHTLLAKSFGVFTVKTKYIDEVKEFHVMLQECSYQPLGELKYIFDLKGSLVNRHVANQTKASTVLKDQNFLDLNQEKRLF